MSIEMNFYIQLIFLVLTFAILYRLIRTNTIADRKVKEAVKKVKRD